MPGGSWLVGVEVLVFSSIPDFQETAPAPLEIPHWFECFLDMEKYHM
jgi:hypothetical protein